tara:strand:- start:197 stop:379 length:183 start_codon:yes stop_codon:yes gene_type:complete
MKEYTNIMGKNNVNFIMNIGIKIAHKIISAKTISIFSFKLIISSSSHLDSPYLNTYFDQR